MTNTILHRRSSTPGAAPTTSVLTLGEVVVNTYDGKMYMLQNNGTAIIKEIGAVYSVAGRTGAITLAVADVSGAAPLASPIFTGNPQAPTPGSTTDNTTSIATTAWVNTAVADNGVVT